MRQISEALLATFFPTACQLCGQLVETKACGVICQSCWDSYLPFQLSKLCQKCGYPSLPLEIEILPPKDCVYCRNALFSIARSCGAYQGAIRASVLQLKTSPYLSEKLFDLIENTLTESNILKSVDLIIPIPLHQTRLTERGFNQAELISEKISNLAKITLDNASLARIKPTLKHRIGMDKIDRSNSLKGAFQVIRPRLIANQIILLVDDVFTTGSTIFAATDELIKAKAKEVKVFTLARTI
jgi:competence protein ComFC